MENVRTLKFALNRTTQWYPDSEAFVQGFGGEDRRYTFAEANREARFIAHALWDHGGGKGDRVALLNDSTVEHALVHFGCTKFGAVPAGLHTREAPTTLAEMVNDIRATVLVFHPQYAAKVDRFRGDLEHTDALVALDRPGDCPAFAHPLSNLLGNAHAADLDVPA